MAATVKMKRQPRGAPKYRAECESCRYVGEETHSQQAAEGQARGHNRTRHGR